MLGSIIVQSPFSEGFILEFGNLILCIDPPLTTETLNSLIESAKSVEIILSEVKNINTLTDFCNMFRVITPLESDLNTSLAITYREEEAIIFTHRLCGYYLNPPIIAGSSNSRFILLVTHQLNILYVPRVTFIEKPLRVDLALTYNEILEYAIAKSSGNPLMISKYLGCNPQWCLVKSTKDIISSNIVYLNKKKYRASRHLSEVVLREVNDAQSGARSSHNQSRSEVII
ncbi:MAG: hypothetical protein NDP13_02585 [Crenarchaeota archaeon]|nr:hypothetical protein [Thermoproteota archaeon]MCR8455325.1 hypothetical protein [Thermoproteota archaeon]MCR8501380.1 hypothetical protein [Thermoproteota archaeon]